MEDTKQRELHLYCVISTHIVGNFLQYPEHKEFLIKSDQLVESEEIRRAVREYVAMENQLNVKAVSIHEMTNIESEEDINRWIKIVCARGWCYWYYKGRLFKDIGSCD